LPRRSWRRLFRQGDHVHPPVERAGRENVSLDRAGDFSTFRYPISPAGKGFAADRLAARASLLRDLWWSAWRNSEKPPKRRGTEE
jgi:hypothetical protein